MIYRNKSGYSFLNPVKVNKKFFFHYSYCQFLLNDYLSCLLNYVLHLNRRFNHKSLSINVIINLLFDLTSCQLNQCLNYHLISLQTQMNFVIYLMESK